ncbi:MAG: SH3 domain-containing protein [Romboutsia sp.]|nr:SH3 domain-containing protein [Romboutsia sp.]
MGKVYYNQADPRWGSHPYPAPGYENATVASAGCGPTCAAMVVSSCRETIRPDTMCDISKENGYRVSGGTSDGLFSYVAQRWGIEMKVLHSSYEAHQACKEGYFVVICCGAGLWTTGGHFILAVGANNSDIEIYDPYLYAGKFDRYGRAGKVNLIGNSAWVNIDVFKANSNAQRFYAFKVDSAPIPEPIIDPQIKYVNTQSLNLNVRNAPGGDVIGSLPKGTQVLVYEEYSGWSRIGDNKWVSSDYLSSSKPVTSRTMYVNTQSLNLNVRNAPGGSVINSLAKGTEVTVVAEQNGWSQITSPVNGWVSSEYLADSQPSSGRHTEGQVKRFKDNTVIFNNSNLTGTRYNYLPNTSVKILENVSSSVDKIYVLATGRVGYVNINAYK